MNYRMLLTRAVFCGLATMGCAYGGPFINGDFETGIFAPWTYSGGDASLVGVTGPSRGTDAFGFCKGALVKDCSTHSASNSYAAFFPNSSPGGITQSFDTVAGYNYSVVFWLSVGVDKVVGNSPFNTYSVFWDSTLLAVVTNPDRAGGWQQIIPLNAISTASTSSLTFSFSDNTDAFGLDDVTVTQGAPVVGSAVPEPVSLILAGTSLIALAGLSRLMRRKRR